MHQQMIVELDLASILCASPPVSSTLHVMSPGVEQAPGDYILGGLMTNKFNGLPPWTKGFYTFLFQ